MGRDIPGGGACCLPQSDGLTYLKVGERSVVVGMQNLETVFRQLLALGRHPEEIADEEIVGMARKFNYIPDRAAVEADYAHALRRAYARFCAEGQRQVGEDNHAD